MGDAPAVSFAPSEELDLIRSTARQFLEQRVPMERVRELMMSDSGFDDGLWKEMAGMGWTGLAISEEHGGSGLGHVEMAVLLEEMGTMVTPGPFFASAVVATSAIQECATAEQCAALLPALASGETIATLAVFEEARRWTPERPSTTATSDDGGWVIDGSKRAVLAGERADLLLVTAATEEGVGLFVVDPSSEGVVVTGEPALDPTRRQAAVTLESVRVPEPGRLGGGDLTSALRRVLALATTAL
ncbi:MAG TPA: acyl-CoA dehydrogenase family protein, partial [Acidimicrobiia bacterium]|nr:acyl-CoA dehydrogenase family protein [Acidimicrobiia bacterium]